MKLFKFFKWSTLVSGILLVLLGIMSLFLPAESLLVVAVLISIAVLVSGIASLVNYFSTPKEERSGWMLAEAILSTLIGIWMVFGSGAGVFTLLIPYIFAVMVTVSGILRIVESVELKRDGSSRWGWLLAFGILTAVLGVFLFFAPLISVTVMAFALSFAIISYGISNITLFYNIQKTGNYIKRRIRDFKTMHEAYAEEGE